MGSVASDRPHTAVTGAVAAATSVASIADAADFAPRASSALENTGITEIGDVLEAGILHGPLGRVVAPLPLAPGVR